LAVRLTFRRPPNQAELRVDLLNGSRITLFGADNPDALRGPCSDGVVLDEYADIAPSLWKQVVRPPAQSLEVMTNISSQTASRSVVRQRPV
jgi:hypothetical protein